MTSTELTQVSKALADMDAVSVGLATLRDKFGGVVFEVSTTQGMTDAKAARAAIREPRYSVESIRKEAKAPILALGKKLDAEAKRITDELLKIENPIQEQIASEEARKERERQAKIEAELARVKAIQDRIESIRRFGSTLDAGPEGFRGAITKAEEVQIDDSFAEFRQAAQDAKDASLGRLRQALDAAVSREAELERIKAERAELERLRAENARREAEDRARREAEEREAKKLREAEEARAAEQRRLQKEQDDREAAARRKILDEQEAAARQAREAEATRQRQEREAHEARLKAEREEQEAAARAERERIADEDRRAATARAAEEARIANERADLERQQSALRKAQEPVPTRMRPKASVLVGAIAAHFSVTTDTALQWLRNTDFSKTSEAA